MTALAMNIAPAEPTSPGGSPAQVNSLLLTMDVVDRLRHEQSQLASLSDTDGRTDAMRRKLIDLYAAQGIEVSDAIIDQAIAAQRERRFEYQPATGLKALLAKAWVLRRSVALLATAALGVLLLSLLSYRLAFVTPVERRAEQALEVITASITAIPSVRAEIEGAAAALPASVANELAVAQAAPKADRIKDASLDAGRAAIASAEAATATLAALPPPPTAPTLDAVKQDAAGIERRVNAYYAQLKDAANTVRAGAARVQTISSLALASTALEKNHLALTSRTLTGRTASEIETIYDQGDRALRQSQPAGAFAAAKKLDDIGAQIGQLADARVNADAYYKAGQSTNPDVDGRKALTGAYGDVTDALGTDNLSKATVAMGALKAIVETLQAEVSYRIPNRQGVKAGVYRIPNDSPSSKNYYLVVEPFDANGQKQALPIRSEEDGSVRTVSIFAVRVPEAVYEQVKADKLDNGIVDNADIGQKPRGSLTPSFKVPTSGGYITEW